MTAGSLPVANLRLRYRLVSPGQLCARSLANTPLRTTVMASCIALTLGTSNVIRAGVLVRCLPPGPSLAMPC